MILLGEAMELLSFKAAGEYMGMEAQYVHRIVNEVNLTPLPLVPSPYMGLIYYRGEVFDVIHIGSLLKGVEARYDETTRVIILKWASKKLAVVPDHIIGLVWVEDIENEKASCARPPLPIDPNSPEPANLPREVSWEEGEMTVTGEEGVYTVRLISPDFIREKASGLSYGPHKV
jgi:hypothetical protein